MFGGGDLYDTALFFLLACPGLEDHTEYGMAVYMFKGEPHFWAFDRNEGRLLTQNADVLGASLQMLTSQKATEDVQANTLVNGRLVASGCSEHRATHVTLPLRYPDALEVYVDVRAMERIIELRLGPQMSCLRTFFHYLSCTCHHRAQFDCLALAINVAVQQSAFWTMQEYLVEVARSRNRARKEQYNLWVKSGLASEPTYKHFRFPVCADNALHFC